MKRLLLALLLAATSLAYGATPVQPLDRVIAVVDDDVITHNEVEQRLQSLRQQLAHNKTSAPPDAILRRQLLERMILERIQLALAQRIGIRVDDENLNQIISNIATQNHMDFDQFRAALQRDGIAFADFREEIRNEVIITRLRATQVDNRVTVSPQEVKSWLESRAAQDQSTEYHLAQILIALPESASPDEVQTARARAEEVLTKLRGGAEFREMAAAYSGDQQALEGGDLGWRRTAELPTFLVDHVIDMKPGALSDIIRSTSGFHILKLIDKRGEERQVVRQVHARHILIRTDAITSDAEAKARLTRLRQRILAGEDFATLARANSDDKGSGSQGGDLGWANPGTFVPEFEAALSQLAVGATSDVFRTQFGWHIVQLLGYRDHDSTDEMRFSQAQEALRKRKIEEEQQNWLRRLRDEAYVEYHLEE
ncbi:MAG TPA: peptidylprolyl isomerase [Gammaproteobacteria bacterium]